MEIKNFWLTVIFLLASLPAVSEVRQAEETHTEQTGNLANDRTTQNHEGDHEGEEGHDDKGRNANDHDDHNEDGLEENDRDEHGEEKGHGDHEEGGHDEHGKNAPEEEPSVKLTAEQIAIAGIVSEAVQFQEVSDLIIAPGEVVLNTYETTSVTPRVSAQVMKRHAKLGDVVTVGLPLLTLSSVEMANAQGALLVNEREWQRVRKLGIKIVSASRFTEAKVAREQSKARVLA